MDKSKVQKYIQILEEELVPALGCTEPIAIAYAGAHLKKIMGGIADELLIESSGNIIKNANIPLRAKLSRILATYFCDLIIFYPLSS